MGAWDTTWREEIEKQMQEVGETWAQVVACTLSDEELDVEFDCSYGGTRGKPFTLWTHNRVYFPGCYDGSEWCASVERNPSDKATEHVGGG